MQCRVWPKVSQTPGHAFLTGWCAISSFYEKGKVSALTALIECNFSSPYSVFGETIGSESDLMKAEKAYISAWYGQTKGVSLAEARYLLYTLKRNKHMKVISLPPTTYFVIPCKSCHHTWSYLVSISCRHDWWSCWPAKPTPPTFCKVWLGLQWWLSDSSNCKLTNRASATKSIIDNACNCIATRNTCSTKSAVVIVKGMSCTVQSCWYIFP